MSRHTRIILLAISIVFIMVIIMGIIGELRFRSSVSSVSEQTREIGIYFSSGRRDASGIYSITSRDGNFNDDKIDVLIKILEEWKYKSTIENYSIDFREASITDSGLLKLQRLPKIRSIHVAHPAVSEEGIDKFLSLYNEPCEVYLTKDNDVLWFSPGLSAAYNERL